MPAGADHLDNPNLLNDPSFEGVLMFNNPPQAGVWEGFALDSSAMAAFSTTNPRTGAQSLELTTSDVDTFAVAFQEVVFGPGLEGSTAYFSGWHTLIGDAGGTEIRIEWRDSVNNIEISRTANITNSPGSLYEEFILMAAVPAGADAARVVYAAQSFDGAVNQQIFVDDANFNIALIPAPGAFALLGVAGFVGVRRRR